MVPPHNPRELVARIKFINGETSNEKNPLMIETDPTNKEGEKYIDVEMTDSKENDEKKVQDPKDEKKDDKILKPWYKNFTGTIQVKTPGSVYTMRGVIKKIKSPTETYLKITELPVSTKPVDYKDFLEKLKDDQCIQSYEDNCTDAGIEYSIHLDEKQMSAAENFKGMCSVFLG